jgi:hypothetical protein
MIFRLFNRRVVLLLTIALFSGCFTTAHADDEEYRQEEKLLLSVLRDTVASTGEMSPEANQAHMDLADSA